MKNLIIFVCKGNIHKSAIAEICLTQEFEKRGLDDKFKVISRSIQGTAGMPSPEHKNLMEYPREWLLSGPILEELQIDISKHQSKPINGEVVGKACLIFAMDQAVLSELPNSLANQFPEYRSKMKLFSELEGKKYNLPDCYESSDEELHRYTIATIVRVIREKADSIIRLCMDLFTIPTGKEEESQGEYFLQISKTLKEIWQLSYEPISVRFTDAVPTNISCRADGNFYRDTACTAICRCIKQRKTLVIAPENNCLYIPSQPCAGANFFLKLSRVSSSEEEANKVYVETEQVFRDKQICQKFLQNIPAFPDSIKGKFIILSPLSREISNPEVVIFLVNASQASKILGLSACHNYQTPEIIPAAPTCISLYLPLVNNKVHVNFIDYYDRYYQGKQEGGQLIWRENELLVSITFEYLQTILTSIDYSPHGNFHPKIEPRLFDSI